MYRGSSFLLQKDYRVHIPIIEEIFKTKYDVLCGIECQQLKDMKIQELLFEQLVKNIKIYYNKVRDSVKKQKIKMQISDTLITKILMGTMGCVPAYDRYFISGIKKTNVATGIFNKESIEKLIDFYENNKEQFETQRKTMKIENLSYPQMKLLDMGFWQLGYNIETKNKHELY